MATEETKAEAKAKAGAEKEEVKAEAKAKKGVVCVKFTRKDGTTREFVPALHGEDFVKVADEFAETNKAFIAKREDLAV
jgi:hypothetical protein